jgi:mono/diheme cytochrome c family protein
MTTAGNLVFQGSAPRSFSAFRADTGERVWTTETQANIVGGSATYTVDGEQYIAVVAAGQGGFGGSYWAPNYARLLVYKLGGKAVLPEPVVYTPPTLNPPANFGDDTLLALGKTKYNDNCASCHGGDGRVTSVFPDLRYAGALHSPDAFKAIVIDGALEPNGMVSFRKVLKPADAEAIRAYVTKLANDAKNAPPGFGFGPGPGAAAPAAAPAPTPSQSAAPTPAPSAPHQ